MGTLIAWRDDTLARRIVALAGSDKKKFSLDPGNKGVFWKVCDLGQQFFGGD